MDEFNVEFSIDNIDVNVDIENTDEDFDANIDDVYYVSVADHNLLYNRDLEDQHPIRSITGLSEKLDNVLDIRDVIVFDGKGE